MPSASKRKKSSNKRKQISITISRSQPTSQSQGINLTYHSLSRSSIEDEERENCVEIRLVQVKGKEDTGSSNHKQMDESENQKIDEEPHKEEFRSNEEVIVIESVNVENFETVKDEETHEVDEFSMDQRTINVVVDLEGFHDEKEVVLDSHIVDSLSKEEEEEEEEEEDPVENLGTSGSGGVFEFKANETDDQEEEEEEKVMVVSDEKNVAEEIDDESNEVVVSTAVMDLVSKEFDSSLSVEENGFQTSVSMGIEETLLPASDETVALDLGSHLPSVEASKGSDNCSMTELPEGTENQPYIAVPTHPLQRTSWRDCCGLFQVLRRFN